jgi:hypothetical protein
VAQRGPGDGGQIVGLLAVGRRRAVRDGRGHRRGGLAPAQPGEQDRGGAQRGPLVGAVPGALPVRDGAGDGGPGEVGLVVADAAGSGGDDRDTLDEAVTDASGRCRGGPQMRERQGGLFVGECLAGEVVPTRWSSSCLPDTMSHPNSVGTGAVMRPDTLDGYAAAAGFTGAERLSVAGSGFWNLYRLGSACPADQRRRNTPALAPRNAWVQRSA